jgi:3-dehydroquinate dehydratase
MNELVCVPVYYLNGEVVYEQITAYLRVSYDAFEWRTDCIHETGRKQL